MGYAPDWMRGNMKKSGGGVARYADGSPGGVSYEDTDDFKSLMAAAERESNDARMNDMRKASMAMDERDDREAQIQSMPRREAPAPRKQANRSTASQADVRKVDVAAETPKKSGSRNPRRLTGAGSGVAAETPKKSGSRNPSRLTGAGSTGKSFLERMFSINDNPRLRRERAELSKERSDT